MGADGWECSEGETIALQLHTQELPVVIMAGRNLQSVALKKVDDGFISRFEILIDTWAGRSSILVRDAQQSSTLTLNIAPHKHKASTNEFDMMLTELSRRSPGLIWGLSPGSEAGSSENDALLVVHPAILSSQLPLFERLLVSHFANPPTALRRVRESRPLDLARRADLKTLRWIGRRPSVVASISNKATLALRSNERPLIEQPSTIQAFDHPLTRYILYLLIRLKARFKNSAELLRAKSFRTMRDADLESHANLLASEMDAAAKRMHDLQAHPLFRGIAPEPLSATILQMLADEPAYNAMHQCTQRLLSPGLAYGPDGKIEAALKHSYDIFELFVLCRLVGELPRKLGNDWKLLRHDFAKRKASIEERLDGATWVFRGPDGLEIDLLYQRRFGRVASETEYSGFKSISGENVPDYILRLRKNGKLVSWLILDAKYRSGRQPLDQGLGDVHRYRDALRCDGTKAAGAFVIAPRLQNKSELYATRSYYHRHKFGVVSVFDSDWISTIRSVLFEEQLSEMSVLSS
ncbi:MAG: DUF2357 domain-containing protein [Xanthobacteraceae bacterium]|nr:DUF2357 domain-containing protein [Xanthobacteraceae bacterium]